MDEEERQPKLFTLTEAERTRREVEPVLIEAMDHRRKVVGLDQDLGRITSRIMLLGGSVPPYVEAAKLRREREELAEALRSALERIEATGCVVKDIEVGLVDFPAMIDNEEVYLCWRLGEDRIRFWHRMNEGFAGRKPLDPRDSGPRHPVQ